MGGFDEASPRAYTFNSGSNHTFDLSIEFNPSLQLG